MVSQSHCNSTASTGERVAHHNTLLFNAQGIYFMKKYELVIKSMKVFGYNKLYRIRALKSFGDVQEGDIGGWIEKESNLSHQGDAWVFDNAWIYGNASVSGDAMVYGKAHISGNARISGYASVSGNVSVSGNAAVSDNVIITGNSVINDDVKISGHARISGQARIVKCNNKHMPA